MPPPQQQQRLPSSPAPQHDDAGHNPFFHTFELDVNAPLGPPSPLLGGTTPVLQATSALSLSSMTPALPMMSPSHSASSGATTPIPGLSQRRRAPAPGTIDLSFLAPRRPSLPSISPLPCLASSPRRVSLPENVHSIMASSFSSMPPARPPRDFPTPAALPNIVTPAAGWFGSHMIWPGNQVNCKSTVSSPLAPGMLAPGAPKVGCGVEGAASPCTFSPLPRTPLPSSLPKTGYFAIPTHVSKLANGQRLPVQSPPVSTLNRSIADPKLLCTGRPKIIRSRFSSVETPGIYLSEIQEFVTDDDITSEDDKREREDETLPIVEVEPRHGDGWAQADAARKRVLLEWETKRKVVSSSSSSPSLNQTCGAPAKNRETLNTIPSRSCNIHHKAFGLSAPLISPSIVFAPSPLASQAIAASETDTEDQAKAVPNGSSLATSPPMVRSSSWTAQTSTSVSPWRRSAGRRSYRTTARSKLGDTDDTVKKGDENVDVSLSGLQNGLFSPTAVIGSPKSETPTPSALKKARPLPMFLACSTSSDAAQENVDDHGQELGLALNFDQKDKPSVRRSKSTTEVHTYLPDLPRYGVSRNLKPALLNRRGSSSSIRRNFAAVYTPPPLIPFPSPVGGCRPTAGDESNTRVNPYFPVVV